MYKKSGVVVSDIQNADCIQACLFDHITNRPQRAQLMTTMDTINHRYGLKTLHLAVEGGREQRWRVKCQKRSRNYLTNINELLTIKV